ncbi:MAG: GGDEF domain-containing protein [Acholeplasmataceae bacterium]|nr:GGDEF domain-containing protein [Acholeplasmataceae bacterium]
MKYTKVFLRESNQFVTAPIKESSDFIIDDETVSKWQDTIDLVADILEVPAGLIMRITEEHMQVFLKSSNTENPYPADGKDKLGHGLYCETVIGTDSELYVENSLENKAWRDNPDVALNMISYLGYPIKLPDGSFFGTICVLDNKLMKFNEKHKKLLETLKNSIETDILMIERNQQIRKLSNTDILTGLNNRRRIEEMLKSLQEEVDEGTTKLSIAIIDLDNFKYVNDHFGHHEGDDVLKIFSEVSLKHLKKSDIMGRYGGDEFILISKNIENNEQEKLLMDIRNSFEAHPKIKKYKVSFSFGTALVNHQDIIYEVLREADHNMYEARLLNNHTNR